MSEGNENGNGNLSRVLTAEDLADVTRFRFKERTLEIEEIGGSIVLKSLSVREREELFEHDRRLEEREKDGSPTEAALESAGKVFSVVLAEPKVDAEAATKFLGSWPVEAFDKVIVAYREMLGSPEGEKAAYGQFPDPE